MSDEVLHYMTQNNQPYGSQRRCCEECGIMIWPHPQPTWTDDLDVYKNPPSGLIPCNKIAKEQRSTVTRIDATAAFNYLRQEKRQK